MDAARQHPEQRDRTIDAVFADEHAELRPLGRPFDGYVEKTVRVRSTCLAQYDSNRYSVPARFAGQRVSLRAYADRIKVVANQDVIAEHKKVLEKTLLATMKELKFLLNPVHLLFYNISFCRGEQI